MLKMANIEKNTAGAGADQIEKMGPSEEEAPPICPNGTLPPLNFSELTPTQFGISVQSFIPAASSNSKDKSRLAQIKARRRSNIGVRGSPETNSLIRFMAQQRMKTPTHQTPESVRSSPYLPRVVSTLRQKMATFQSVMDVEESGVCDLMPKDDRNIGGYIKTRDYLSDGNSFDEGKENQPTAMMPTPKKRRYLGPLKGCEVQIREAGSPNLHFNVKKQEEDLEPVTHVLTRGPLPSSETVEKAQAVLMSPTLHVHSECQACSPAENQKDGAFKLQSPNRPLEDDPAIASPAYSTSLVNIPSVPSLLEMKPTGESDAIGICTVKKKKQVRFGGPLSPEFFDRDLPPSTPLQKGGTPARAPTPGDGLQLRSLLKTPQRSEAQTPKSQPNLSSPNMFGASPTLPMPRHYRIQHVEEDYEEKVEKIVFPSMEESDSDVASGAESETTPSTVSVVNVMNEAAAICEQEKQSPADIEPPAPVRSRNQRKKPELGYESTSKAPARSRSQKRKQPEESEPAKRSTRSAAKLASGKMKVTSQTTWCWNRGVDRSLYGSREYASKNPSLSPITERLSFTPEALQAPSTSCTGHEASQPETLSNPEANDSTQVTRDPTVTHILEKPLGDLVTPSNSDKGGKQLSRRRVKGKRLKRQVSLADCDLLRKEPQDQTEGKPEEHFQNQTTTNLKAARKTLKHTVAKQRRVDIELGAQTSAMTPTTDSKRELEHHANLNTRPSSGEELNHTMNVPAEVAKRKAKQSLRSSVNSPPLQEQADLLEEHQNRLGDQAASNPENDSRSSSDTQEENGVADLDLAPSLGDFNLEDVFKPVATRGQHSVRRSMRNKCNADKSDNSAGLAWLPWTSPNSSKEVRRRSRSFCSGPLVQSSLLETQNNDS
ncbi:cell division cycle-associated protein 2 isoform X2 [Echeneis naucrates]|uniref:cell division cycle-associated protein 2 isoform X2 n=1 Tax=Echeneis naucrates TaxID=173247 RepID=UPI0011144000|nr:cell division cycle-associated protein 2 isoform X2 [Echeneis naucrates]